MRVGPGFWPRGPVCCAGCLPLPKPGSVRGSMASSWPPVMSDVGAGTQACRGPPRTTSGSPKQPVPNAGDHLSPAPSRAPRMLHWRSSGGSATWTRSTDSADAARTQGSRAWQRRQKVVVPEAAPDWFQQPHSQPVCSCQLVNELQAAERRAPPAASTRDRGTGKENMF